MIFSWWQRNSFLSRLKVLYKTAIYCFQIGADKSPFYLTEILFLMGLDNQRPISQHQFEKRLTVIFTFFSFKILSQYWLRGEQFYFMHSLKLINWWISKVSRKRYHIPQFTGIKSNKVSLKKSNHGVRQGTENIIDNCRRNNITDATLRTGSIAGYAGYSPVFQPRRVNSVCQPNSRRCK